MPTMTIMIVDDQHLFAEGLKYVLHGESDGELEVIGTAEDGKQAVELARRLRPQVILMDIRMPIMDGVKATEIIHKEFPETKIMILTTFDDDELAYHALSCGASGYVLKNIEPPDLVLSIKAVHSGGLYISPSVGFKLVEKMKPEKGGEDVVAMILTRIPSLTLREAEVLSLVLGARHNQEIADKLCISEKTVKNHISTIYDKLGIHNRLRLISHMAGLGIHSAAGNES